MGPISLEKFLKKYIVPMFTGAELCDAKTDKMIAEAANRKR